jgi:hypothetical protein
MHVHLPKPLHGWREFVGEVGIIVIGVLIALGAEQILEAVHWQRETDAARAALQMEAADNLSAAAQRLHHQPCIDHRLREIGQILADHAASRPFHVHGDIGRPVSYYGSTDAWDVEVASQALTHMSLDEKLALSTAFSNYKNLNSVLRLEQTAWLRLDILNSPEQLEAGDWPPLRQAYAEAKSLSSRLQIISSGIVDGETLGQAPKQLEDQPAAVDAAIKMFCEPILDRSVALKT